MRRWLFTIFSAISLLGLILAILLAIVSFLPAFIDGIKFIGSFHSSAVATASPILPGGPWHEYDIHREYRGLFFEDGWFAVGYLVEDYHIGQQRARAAERQGFQYRGGVATLPLAPLDDWNLLSIKCGTKRYGNPAPPESWFTSRLRFHCIWPIMLTAILPIWWIEAAMCRWSRRSCAESGGKPPSDPKRSPP